MWKNTKQIGAAQATRKDGRLVVVIRYSPPGNIVSKTAFMKNVLPVQKETVASSEPGQICCCLVCKMLVFIVGMALNIYF